MTQVCPFCGPKPVSTRMQFESITQTPGERHAFMQSICDRCFAAIFAAIEDEQPVNEAEMLDGAK